VERREFIRLVGAGLAAFALGVGGGYVLGRGSAAQPQAISTPTPAQTPQARRVRSLWIYVGPVEDIGWTAAHHEGRGYVASKFGWLEARYIEKVSEDRAKSVIEAELSREKYDAVFATSYGFKTAIKELAPRYPGVKFYHCSGEYEYFEGVDNVATYFAEFYQLYYLNGVAAGASTETCRVGYVPAFLIPEVVRHINAFALGAVYGARVAGKCGNGERLEIYSTSPLEAWFAPDKARDYATYLVNKYDVDVIAYTEDTTAVLDVAESFHDKGKRVYSFSHYSNMYEYYRRKGRTLRAHLTGQVVNWGPIYEYLLSKLYSGAFSKEDIWARVGDFTPFKWKLPSERSTAGLPEGAVYLAPLNTEVIHPKAVAEIKRLYEDMKELLFEPFTGPIRGYKIDFKGRPQEEPRLKVGQVSRLGRNDLWYMDWFYEKIISPA